MQEQTSSNSLGERVPKLRFPGFEGGWDFEIFSDLFTFLSNNTLSRAELSEAGNIRNIHYGDILVKYAAVVNIDDEIIPFVSNNSEGKVRCDVLRTGDVIIADTAEDDTVGKAIEIINHNNKSVVSGLHTMPCRPNRDFTASFLGYYINSNTYHSQLYPYMQGIKVTSISKANIGKTLIHFPSRSEQKKIVGLFNLIEKKILIQKKLVEAIKLYKRGLLSKLFPQKGESVPQYRFTEFTDAWEQRKVKDIAPLQRGFDLPTSQIEEGVYPVVMSNGIGGYHSQYKVKGPGIVTGRSGTIGKLHYIEDDYWPHNTTLWVTNFYGNNQKFVYYMYQCMDLSHFSTGSGVPTLNRNDVHDGIVCIPSTSEQKKISDYLTTLDHLITLHQRKCNEMQSIKKFMLQNMFV